MPLKSDAAVVKSEEQPGGKNLMVSLTYLQPRDIEDNRTECEAFLLAVDHHLVISDF